MKEMTYVMINVIEGLLQDLISIISNYSYSLSNKKKVTSDMKKSPILFSALLLSVSLVRGAVVTLESFSSVWDADGGTPNTASLTLEAANNTVLLAAITYEQSDITSGVVFDPSGSNQGMTQLISNVGNNNGNDVYTAIYGLELGTVSAGSIDVTLSTSSSQKNAMSLFQLSNASLTDYETTVDDTYNSQSNPLTASFTGLDTGSFVLASVAAKKAGISFTSGGNASAGNTTNTGWENHHQLFSYLENQSGSVSMTFTGDDSSDETTLAAVGIAAIPEPSSLVLVGLALGALMIFNRKVR